MAVGKDQIGKVVTGACQLAALLILAVLLQACSKDTATAVNGSSDWQSCPAPRPQICTREYRPVCALVDTGVRCITTPCPASAERRYSNACSACADEQVSAYRNGSRQAEVN